MATVRSVSEQVYEEMVRRIIDGSLPPNELLSDRALADQFGVSRTPIREAFHQLESVGLIKRRSRIGWVVTDFNRRDVVELIELRAILETAGVRCLINGSDEERGRVGALFDGFELPFNAESTAEYLRRDHDFHSTIIKATRNSRIIEVYRRVNLQIDRVRHFISYRAQSRVEESLEEHRRITRAIAAKDVGSAIAELNTHLLNVQYKFVNLLDTVTVSSAYREKEELDSINERIS
ncbi:GntR family transcriptional regulator [Halomonas ramblicola]|uniref:GntR family transcriptional regulator n=1 Tax=Halomonas ramblicola TaxID=747349 RepID=UPI0025B35966|nr:GntR family transcriptional regulator [Halomonas ramblicola]MDN3523594.1 GntR family transcriptional regulator [Halomonas ramblicola]